MMCIYEKCIVGLWTTNNKNVHTRAQIRFEVTVGIKVGYENWTDDAKKKFIITENRQIFLTWRIIKQIRSILLFRAHAFEAFLGVFVCISLLFEIFSYYFEMICKFRYIFFLDKLTWIYILIGPKINATNLLCCGVRACDLL